MTNQTLISAFQDGLTAKGLLNWGVVPYKVTLSKPVTLTGSYDLIDDQKASLAPNRFQMSQISTYAFMPAWHS